jgi:Na+-exporting ATPase
MNNNDNYFSPTTNNDEGVNNTYNDSSRDVTQTPPNRIQFDESQNKREIKEYQVHHNEKYSNKSLSRTSTGGSSMDFDTKSVRSVLMHKMSLVKRRRQSIDESEKVEGPPYHTMDLDTVNQVLKSDLEDGLPESTIEEKRAQFGYNEMEGEGGVSPVKLMIKQFTNIMVLILLIAMVSTSFISIYLYY